jgi:hypothetical protein
MRALTLAVVVLLISASCACRTDAQRAKAERAAVEKELRESLALFPYRFIKLSLRSAKSPGRPAAIDGVLKLIEETQALPARPATAEEVAKEAALWARLAKATWDARETMMTSDEDDFPTLAANYLREPLPPPYDAQLEHLVLAGFWFVVDAADKGHKVPGGTQYVFYELMRAEPQPAWPVEARWLALLLRGGSYCATERHYAAEEELTTALTELERGTPGELSGIGDRVSRVETFHGLRAAGYFLRAWNRMGLHRDDAAVDDVEKGLAELKALGIDNEVTQWGWAVVHAHRGRYPEAAAELERLAQSPNLDAETKRELAEAATELRAHGKGIPVLLQARAMVIIGQALLARAGGLENVLRTVLGDERAKELAAPLEWLARTREKLGRSPGQVVEQGKALGAKGLELVKERLDAFRDAGP